MVTPRRDPVKLLLWAVLMVLVVAWAGYLIWGIHFSNSEWAKIVPGYDDVEDKLGPSPAKGTPVTSSACFSHSSRECWLWQPRYGIGGRYGCNRGVRSRLISLAIAIGCILVIYEDLLFRGQQAPWYNVQTMMTHPEQFVFGQRLLLIPAGGALIKHLVPRLTYIQSFLLVQGMGIAVAIYAIGEWSALFVGRDLRFIGQIMLTVMYMPTQLFFSAHDIGVIFIYTFCFTFLYRRQYWLFLIAFSSGSSITRTLFSWFQQRSR